MSRYVARRIVKLLDGGTATKLPLMLLECGHAVRTLGVRAARCMECGKVKTISVKRVCVRVDRRTDV